MFDQLYENEPVDTARAAGAVAVATTKPTEVALDDLDLERLALAYFGPSRKAMAVARDKLVDVVHDLSTAGKLADAKSLRNRLINIPLAEARKVSAGLKSKLNGTSKAVGAELVSIEQGFDAAERLITPQIEAREAELAAEKQAREEKEAARVAAHRTNIAKLAGYVAQAQGKTSAQILTIINGVSGIDILPEQWEEFAVGAEVQKTETLEALQALFDRTKTAEEEAAAREAQRIENERVAAELAEEKRLMAEKQAELDRKLAAIAAAEKAEVDRIAAEAQAKLDAEAKALADAAQAAQAAEDAEDEVNRLAQEAAAEALQVAADATPAEVIADSYAPEPAPVADIDAVAATPWVLPAGPITFAEPPAPAADEEPTLTLGAINARFGAGFTMTAAFVTDILGVAPAGTKKAAVLFRPSQLVEICDALVEHIGSVCAVAA